MNELVYVSDIETYHVVYMNKKARELYRIKSLDELKDKKCHEVLQASLTPCSICNNKKLSSGQFEEWKYFNPVLGKQLLLKDTLIEVDGKKYRMEMAIDISIQEQQRETIEEYANNEMITNEALRLSLSANTPEESIDTLLEYMGKALKSDRMYIFEKKPDESFSNTYEWCAKGVEPQKDNLQHLPAETAAIWMDRFQSNKCVIIRNLEDTKDTDPEMYEYLLPQDIHSLVTGPLIYNNQIRGFYGVDNPPESLINNISTLFLIMGHFIVSLLRRRDLVRRLENLSYHDQLTGLRNRYAMEEYVANVPGGTCIGILNCDIMGLKKVNDSQGHKAGDELIVRTAECLKDVFVEDSLFRIGGDEFLVLCAGIEQEVMLKKVEELKEAMKRRNTSMALGCVWSTDSSEKNIDKLMIVADERMYEDKRARYAKTGESR
jgi:diguanylate cyclase (GGDEF)-like protein